MIIFVDKIDSRYHYHLLHIIKLFYEDPEITFATDDLKDEQPISPDLLISIDLQGEAGFVTAKVIDREGNFHQSREPMGQDEKHTISRALLQVLTSYTGMLQPWGILTGVRPTKLVHQSRKIGLTVEEIQKELEHEFLIDRQKIEIMQWIVDKQLEVIPDLYDLDQEVSVYIGIPFCPTKCAYCTFPAYAITGKQGSVDQFLIGLKHEIEAVGSFLREHNVSVTSIYFGGGTPTSIEAHELEMLFEAIAEHFPNGGKSRELTVEAGRPDTITPEKIHVMQKWKVDRISINPQTFTQRTLQAIGRHHTVEEILHKYELARELGMDNINMDLIVGLPGEGMTELMVSLEAIERLRPDSLTVHTLSFKTASTMTKNKEKYPVASREEVSQMVQTTLDWTKANGYAPYYLYRQKNILGNQENIGYALPGKESIYNIMIMEEKQTIIGLGCGASSKIISPKTKKITRFANPKEPKVYNENYQHYIEGKLALLHDQFLQR